MHKLKEKLFIVQLQWLVGDFLFIYFWRKLSHCTKSYFYSKYSGDTGRTELALNFDRPSLLSKVLKVCFGVNKTLM